MPQTPGNNRIKNSIAVAFLLLVLFGVTVALSSQLQSPNRDFVEYWSSAKLLAQHANPYDLQAVQRLEHTAGSRFNGILVMPNPPSSLFVFAPLGYLPFGLAAAVWQMILLLAAVGSIWLLQPWVPGRVPIVAFFLASVVDCFLAGQCTIVVLFGICLFIRLRASQPWVAGLALTLTVLKPHLLSLFWPILLLEILRTRQFQVAAGAIAGVALASVSALAWDPHIWADYRNSLHGQNLFLRAPLPNLPNGLRLLIWPHSVWLQFIPLALGVPLALWFWWRNRDRWEWHREGALVIAGAVLVSPYSFHIDQVLFLPAILYCYPRTNKAMQGIFWVLNGLAIFLILRYPMLTSLASIWTGPAWMAWCSFIYWRRRRGREAKPAPAGELAVSRA
ncbi:MAG TPA: glycosyltransferase family 87 protein [Acidobacteriaceae bacterium]|nr:glycosyltransferase family 87 protein [Acidobacteriaceae bacterium]